MFFDPTLDVRSVEVYVRPVEAMSEPSDDFLRMKAVCDHILYCMQNRTTAMFPLCPCLDERLLVGIGVSLTVCRRLGALEVCRSEFGHIDIRRWWVGACYCSSDMEGETPMSCACFEDLNLWDVIAIEVISPFERFGMDV